MFRGALQLGGPAPSSHAPPSRGGGGARSFFPLERWDPPPSRACLMLLGRRGLVRDEPHASVSRSGKKRGGYRAILRNLLIQEPRLPFSPTGRHCLNGRSTRKGEKETSRPERVGLELGTLPSGIAPFTLRGLPDPRAPPPPHTDCLTASTAYLGSQKRPFLSLTWELGSFLGKPFTRGKENSELGHVAVRLGTGSFCSPPPGSAVSYQGTFPTWASSPSPLLSPRSLCLQ